MRTGGARRLLPRAPRKYSTYWVRVPASGVRSVPRTVAPRQLMLAGYHPRPRAAPRARGAQGPDAVPDGGRRAAQWAPARQLRGLLGAPPRRRPRLPSLRNRLTPGNKVARSLERFVYVYSSKCDRSRPYGIALAESDRVGVRECEREPARASESAAGVPRERERSRERATRHTRVDCGDHRTPGDGGMICAKNSKTWKSTGRGGGRGASAQQRAHARHNTHTPQNNQE